MSFPVRPLRAGGTIRQIALGPFVLETRIGRGGMGEVWRARHQAEGVRVAVKLLTAKGASETMFVESFKNEVRAVAPLEHPHIAMVLDYGSVPESAAKASKGRLVAGTPFLSMELLEGTTLADHMGTLDWPEIERLLLCLLDALAHAHARAVIHRDLKLSNVLYDTDSGRVKLTDFGIAHAMATTDDPFRWGTPAYMPPEQLLGRWWDYGPWTDLYSLGCCAYTLITGHRAFPDEIKGNLKDRILPPLRPRMAVPRGIEGWLETLTAPRVASRYQLAADAAYALVRLREADQSDNRISVLSKKPVKPRTETTIALALSELDGSDLAEETLVSYLPSDTRVPPMPSRWRPPRDAERSTMLLGAGLGLSGLRRIPMVGREEERTQLWRELSAVRASGRARLVLLHGPAGSGKTRLGEWLCERANEVGAALVMRASHGPDSGTSGIVEMVGRYLRTGGLSDEKVLDRVQQAWAGGRPAPDPAELQQMATLVSGEGDADATAPADPSTLVRRFLVNQARHRPLIVFLDDVQWGADALHMAHQLLSAQPVESAPVLVVLCAREEALPDQPTERALIDELVESYGVRIKVDRLAPSEHHDLIQELIGLEGALARRVEERTAGNPLFAVQLIGDWVERGILRPGRRGFQLRDSAEVVVPDDLYAVWRERVDELVRMRPDSDRLALEIAAILGQVVIPEEWLGACRARGLRPSEGLLDTLLSRRLASAEEGGAWSFAHSMLRESLHRSAVEAGRAAGHHRACAAMLQASGQAVGERLARHLVRAGALGTALEPTVRAIQAAIRAGDFNR
ncbi:MAG: AAA family ATPase, partial [Myxococcota bacterium]